MIASIPRRRALEVLQKHLEALEAVLLAGRRANVMGPLEDKLHDALAVAFKAQGKVFLNELERYAYKFTRESYLTPLTVNPFNEASALTDAEFDTAWDTAVQDTSRLFTIPLEDALAGAYTAGVETVLSDLPGRDRLAFTSSGSFTLANPRAVAAARATAGERVANINFTTRMGIRSAIANGAENGESYQKIAQQIRSTFSGFGTPSPIGHIRDRAELVAVTELAFAYGAGTRQTADALGEAGLQMEKSWLPTTDPCPVCEQNDTEGWIPLEDNFSSGDANIPAHPGCRCDILYRRIQGASLNLPDKPTPTSGPPPLPDEPFQYVGDIWTWAKANYPNIEFDFQGTHPETMDPTIREFHRLAQEWPEVATRLKRFGVRTPANSALKGDNWYAYATRNGEEIALNPKYYGDPDIMLQSHIRGVASKWSPPGTENIASTLTHEWGHQVDNWLNSLSEVGMIPYVDTSGFGLVGDTFRAWRRAANGQRPKTIWKSISNYAATNEQEAWAESFSALQFTPKSQWSSYTKLQYLFLQAFKASPRIPKGEWSWIVDLPTAEERDMARRLRNDLFDSIGMRK